MLPDIIEPIPDRMMIGLNLGMQVLMLFTIRLRQVINLLILPVLDPQPDTNNESEHGTNGAERPAQHVHGWFVHYLLNDLTTCAAK